MTHEEIADAIAERLFVNGFGEAGDRLLLVSEETTEQRDLGGWCQNAVKDQVLLVLRACGVEADDE